MRIRTLAPFALVLTIACGGEAGEDAEMTEEEQSATEAMPEASGEEAMAELTDYWATHYDMGHPGMVADKFAEDAIIWDGHGSRYYGREAIAGALESAIEAGRSDIEFHPDETLVFGHSAVAIGHFVASGMAGDEEVMNSGYYMSLAEQVDGVWMLKGFISNLDAPDQPMMEGMMMESPTEGEGAELIQEHGDYVVAHYNMGHASMVADRYAEDAVVMPAGAPSVSGRAAVQEWLQSMMDAGVSFDGMTGWGAHELDESHVLGAGDYSVESPDGTMSGHFAGLYVRGEDGSLQARWLITG